MKTTSEFLKLAERIGENIGGAWFCCNDLPMKEAKQFKELFEPTKRELNEYDHVDGSWMSEIGAPYETDNNLRILALCLAHEIYKTENAQRP